MRQLLLDTETTGFEPGEGHRIIEFAALEMIDRKLTGNSLHLYFNPERDIPQEATNVHGITMEQVANEAPFRERVDEILNYIDGAELIIHNAKFDLKFLDHHFLELTKRYGIKNSMCEYAWQNGKAERVNGIIKNNYLNYRSINSFEEMVREVDRAVKAYNQTKPHKALQRMSPVTFENKLLGLPAVNSGKLRPNSSLAEVYHN